MEGGLLDAVLIGQIVAVVVPILTGLLTKISASPGVKGTINFLLVGAGTVAANLVGLGEIDWKVYLVTFGITFAQDVAIYFGVYKPRGTTQAIQERTADFGIETLPFTKKAA